MFDHAHPENAAPDADRRATPRRRTIDMVCRAATEMLERVTDAFIALDGAGRVVYVNRRAAELMGHPAAAIIGRPAAELLPQEMGAALLAAAERATRQQVVAETEARHEALGVWLSLRAFPFDDGLAVYVQDISTRKRADAEREALLEGERAARTEAEAAGRSQSEFLATMSHEFRTPLNAFKGYLQLIEMGLAGPVTEQQREYLRRLGASSEHLLTLVNDVLDVAKADAGRLEVAREHADAATAIGAALEMTRPLAEARGVRLVYGGRPARGGAASEGTAYVGDEDRVRQILVNLLSNAVKFTEPPGTVTLSCGMMQEAPPEARVRGEGPWTRVTVRDTGIGIAPEQQAAVFEPFHQVEGGHTRRADGTGLGLTISRRLARLMGGDLTVRSAPGEGSSFTLWLPAAGEAPAGGRESAELRGARAKQDPAAGRAAAAAASPGVPTGLADIGQALRAEIDGILATFAERLRADPETPLARGMRQPALEDHAVTLLGDLAQSLVIVADAGDEAAELLRDGSEIERVVAVRHGLRRHAQGWSEAAVRREYQILAEVVERAVAARVTGTDADAARDGAAAVSVVTRLLAHAAGITLRAWHRAAAEVREE